MRGRSVTASMFALGLLGMAACRVPYRPLTPHAGSADGTEVVLEKIAEGGVPTRRIIATVRFAGARQAPPLAAAWLTAEGSPRCSAGVPSLGDGPDPLQAQLGARELAFDRAAVEAAGLLGRTPTVLDVDVLPVDMTGPRLCVRIPATAGDARPAWAARSRWFLGAGLHAIAPVSGQHEEVGSGALVSFYGGVWLGPARLRLDWEVGEASTHRAVPAGYDRITAELMGGVASLEWFPIRVGKVGVGASAGYEWLFADFHASRGINEQDEYRSGPRGPRAALRVARVPAAPSWPGFWNRKDGWAMGLELSVARWTGPDQLAATYVGLGVAADTGYWW